MTTLIKSLSANSVKNIKLQPVPPSIPSETLSVLFLDIHNVSVALTEAQVVIVYSFLLEYI